MITPGEILRKLTRNSSEQGFGAIDFVTRTAEMDEETRRALESDVRYYNEKQGYYARMSTEKKQETTSNIWKVIARLLSL